jgi:hypothetical protein
MKLGIEYIIGRYATEGESPVAPVNSPQREWMALADAGFYLDPGSHAGAFTGAGFGFRRTSENGRTRSLSFKPASVYRSFLSETYLYDSQGAVEPVTLPGNVYYAPSFSFGIGKYSNQPSQSAWFVQLTVITLMPYNSYVMPLLNLEVGWLFDKRGGAQ